MTKLKSMSDIENEKKSKNKKKETEMKTIENNSTLKTILTVFVTLLAVATIVASFVAGMNYQDSKNKDIQSQAKALATVLSKENQ